MGVITTLPKMYDMIRYLAVCRVRRTHTRASHMRNNCSLRLIPPRLGSASFCSMSNAGLVQDYYRNIPLVPRCVLGVHQQACKYHVSTTRILEAGFLKACKHSSTHYIRHSGSTPPIASVLSLRDYGMKASAGCAAQFQKYLKVRSSRTRACVRLSVCTLLRLRRSPHTHTGLGLRVIPA